MRDKVHERIKNVFMFKTKGREGEREKKRVRERDCHELSLNLIKVNFADRRKNKA